MRGWQLPGVCLVAVFVAALPAHASTAVRQRSVTITLLSASGRTVLRDVEPKGKLNRGDTISGTSVLRNEVVQFGKPKGAVVGSDTYVVTFSSATKASINARVKLPGGTLRVRGPIPLSTQSNMARIPVTGGTGVFEDARGTCVIVQQTPDRALNVYRLRLP